MYTYIYSCMNTCMRFTHVCICIFIYIYIYIYVYIYVYIYTYMNDVKYLRAGPAEMPFPNFIGKAVFICLVGSVNLVLKFQGMFFSAGWTPQNYST